jgi:hypothetical protein
MFWNLRERRPRPTYRLASVANVFACLSKIHAAFAVPVCFNFFNFQPVCPKYPISFLQIVCFFLFLELLLFGGKLLHKPGAKKILK